MMGLMVAATATAPTLAHATNATIDSQADFISGVDVGNEQNMDFGMIDFGPAPGMGDTVSLGTDGTVGYAGGNFSGLGAGTAGSVDVTVGINGATVEVFCDSTATLSNGSGGSIDAVGLEVVPENATGAYGAGAPCNGVAGAAAASMVLNIGTLDTFVFGGQLDGLTAVGFGTGGTFSTSNIGGDDVQVNVFYQ